MWRLSSDQGAVAVLMALLMVPLLACTALVVDVGVVYVERRQLQNAADAGALAIAQDCAVALPAICSITAAMTATASSLVRKNAGPSALTAWNLTGTSTPAVTVTASAEVTYFFAPVLAGVSDSTSVSRRSSASWGVPVGGRAMMPLAFSWCAFLAQTGGGLPTGATPVTILMPKTDKTVCNGPSKKPLPGGFGWLNADSTGCTSTSSILIAQTLSKPGNTPPSICSPGDFVALQNKTILLPIYDSRGGNGSNAWYHIFAYAAFHVTGYSFGGLYGWNNPCSGNDRCIAGYFTVLIDAAENFTYGTNGVYLGARLVKLIA